MSTPEQVAYFEAAVERAAEKLQKLLKSPQKPSACKLLMVENLYAHAIRCHQEAVAGCKWLPQPSIDADESVKNEQQTNT